MLTKHRVYWIIVVGVLLLGILLRIPKATYAYNQPCLVVSEEYWLYQKASFTSLYTWDIKPPLTLPPEQAAPSVLRTIAATDSSYVMLRFLGILGGIFTIALVMCVGLSLRSNWWYLGGLLVASIPIFVSNDRWISPFDFAPLLIAINVLTLIKTKKKHAPLLVLIQTVSALALFLAAPPLWWLSLGLILLQPESKWSVVALIAFIGIISIPALQYPDYWFNAAMQWDVGATASCILIGLFLAMAHWRRLSEYKQVVIGAVGLLLAGVTFVMAGRLPSPSTQEWELISWLQARVPNEAVINFDSATYPLAQVMDCPVQAHLNIYAQPLVENLPYLEEIVLRTPDFSVSTDASRFLNDAKYVYNLNDQFYIERNLDLPFPVDIPLGNLFYILSYQLLTPTVSPGDTLLVRLDYQLGSPVVAEMLHHSIFVRVIQPGQLTEKLVDYNAPLVEDLDELEPRHYMLYNNYHVFLPIDMPLGTYEVVIGVYNPYSGEMLSGNNPFTVGTLIVTNR